MQVVESVIYVCVMLVISLTMNTIVRSIFEEEKKSYFQGISLHKDEIKSEWRKGREVTFFTPYLSGWINN